LGRQRGGSELVYSRIHRGCRHTSPPFLGSFFCSLAGTEFGVLVLCRWFRWWSAGTLGILHILAALFPFELRWRVRCSADTWRPGARTSQTVQTLGQQDLRFGSRSPIRLAAMATIGTTLDCAERRRPTALCLLRRSRASAPTGRDSFGRAETRQLESRPVGAFVL
jgi:hypothetical protein